MSAPAAPSGDELMAVALSRRLRDGWTGIVGAASMVPIAAVLMAQRSHAPKLHWICSGTGFVDPRPEILFPSSTQYEYRAGATAVLPYHEVATLFERGFDFGFFGGLEIDGAARANTVESGSGRPGPGPAGLPVGMSRTRNVLLYTGRHSPRALVETVRHRTGVPRGNVRAIVTPLAEFEPGDGDGGRATLAALLGGELDEVREQTGFDFDASDPVTRLTPTADELALLREVDADGRLRSR